MKSYRSPALPMFATSSRVLAMVTTWFFCPALDFDQADKLVIAEGGRKARKKGKRKRKRKC